MWPRFIRKIDPYGEIRQFGILIVFVAAYIISYTVDYDPRTGWKLVDRPYRGNTVQVTKEQALLIISEGKIKRYGLLRGQIVMRSEPGKWFALNYADNVDVVRQLGQCAAYIPYYYRHDNNILYDLISLFSSAGDTRPAS